jgi:KDO2-lipid IV(A) lauroyltransferase
VFTGAFARGKGVILLSGHFGSWELLASAVQQHMPARLTIVYQTQRNRRVDAFLLESRTRFGCALVSMREAPREVLRALHHGEIAAMLGDQSGASESPFVDFFGRPAATHRGPALFALKSGAPIVMTFFVRQPDGAYAMHFEEVSCDDLHGSVEQQVVELTRRHVAMLEKYLRRTSAA